MTDAPDPCESHLLARIADGDPVAFRLVSNRHVDRLLALATRMLRDRGDAEDVVQECFLRLWRKAGRWESRAAIGTWLHRITYNLCIDRLRKRRATVPVETLDISSSEKPVDRELHDRDVARRLRIALNRLPERQRHAILLVHFQELTGAEAAQVMNTSCEALESLLSRGRRQLRTDLTEDAPDLLGGLQ